MTDWIAAGFESDRFWHSTPREIFIHFDAAAIRAEREHKSRAWHAWHVAALSRYTGKELPTLASLTETKSAPDRQSWQEQRNVARMLTVLFGGTVSENQGRADA